MTMYKYLIFFSFFLFSCEKTNSIAIESNNSIEISLCDGELLDYSMSILSFNRLSTTSLNSVTEIIDIINPDIIALQESYEMGLKIADRFNNEK